jgi:micrococcal nuclease
MGTRIENLQVTKIADGDTISVSLEGKTESLRLACVDTEEKPGSPKRPHTKAGVMASEMAKQYFSATNTLVKVDIEFETDDPVDVCLVKHRDNHGRLLCYVHKGGENYNLKLVREGWSPYFTKYGRSRLYHQVFTEAEAQAQANNDVIWNPETNGGGASRDYMALLPWWGLRDSIVEEYRHLATSKVLSVRLDYQKILKASETGETLTILCDLQNGINKRVRGGAIIKAGSDYHEFNLWIPDLDSDQSIAIINLIGQRYAARKQGVEGIGGRGYAYVSGQVTKYRDIPQIVLTDYTKIADFPPN